MELLHAITVRDLPFVVMALLALIMLGACWAYVVLSPWRILLAWAATMGIQVEVGQFHLGISDILLVPLAMWAVVLVLRRPPRLTPVFASLLIFAGIFCTWGNLVAVLNLGYLPKWSYLNKDVGLAEMLLCVLAVASLVDSRSQLKHLILAFVGGGSLLNFVGLALAVISVGTGFGGFVIYDNLRYVGFMADPNGWAGYLAVIALFQLCLLLFEKEEFLQVSKTLQWGNFGLLVAGVLLSMSRSGILALLSGVCCALLFVSWKRRIAAAGWTLLFAGMLLVPLWGTGLLSLISTRISNPEQITGRVMISRAALSMYTRSSASAMTGIGIGTFIESSEPKFGFFNQIHNTYLWILVEGGPVLLLVFVIIIGSAVSQTLRATKTAANRVLAIAVFCALMSSLVLFTAIEGFYQREFWLLLALPDVFANISPKVMVIKVSKVELRSLHASN